jgi:hypothetical protein
MKLWINEKIGNGGRNDFTEGCAKRGAGKNLIYQRQPQRPEQFSVDD